MARYLKYRRQWWVLITHLCDLHANCRSTTLPFLNENEIGTRFARDINNKGIEVPSNMDYKKWYSIFVENS